jgi:hypothetical protein
VAGGGNISNAGGNRTQAGNMNTSGVDASYMTGIQS